MSRPALLRSSLDLVTAYEKPGPENREDTVAQGFALCLGLDEVGANDDFFDLGGDSLAAASLGRHLERALGVSFPISSIGEYSTPRLLAAFLGEQGKASRRTGQATATEPPIFTVPGQQGYMLPKTTFFTGLKPGQRFHFFELPGLRDKQQPAVTVRELASRYRAEMMAQNPTGPIRLASFCMGGMVAIEMACQLIEHGIPHSLVLVEPSVPLVLWKAYAKGIWKPGQRAPFLESEQLRQRNALALENKLVAQALAGKDGLSARYPDQQFSVQARAKFWTATSFHCPRRCPCPVTILASGERQSNYAASPSLWDELLPERKIVLIGRSHREVLDSPEGITAAALVAAFEDREREDHPSPAA
jgi:thioesterase domain-containing protein/acyl carrier protein